MTLIKPFSDAIDAMQKLRELLHSVLADGTHLRDSTNKTSIRENLWRLYFRPEGILGTLKKYQKTGDIADLRPVNDQLQVSEERVKSAVRRIQKFERFILSQSMADMVVVQNLIFGDFGKMQMRESVAQIIAYMSFEKVDDDLMMTSITQLVEEIELFNLALQEFHDGLIQ